MSQMRSIRLRRKHQFAHRTGASLSASAFCVLVLLSTGCGSNPSAPGSGSGPVPGESTAVAIQLSSTANGQFVAFEMEIDQISLTNAAGKTVTIFSTPTDVDFIHTNGGASPLATVSVPQDTYTSAAVTVTHPRFSYTFVDSQGGVNFATNEYGYTPTPPVVILAEPITVSGSTLGLSLNLQGTPSGTFSGLGSNQTSYTINPTFNLTPFPLTAPATTPLNGKCIGLAGRITAVDATSSMTVTLADDGVVTPATGQSFTAALNSATQFQGMSSAGSLSVGTFVDMDIALQPDASYAATRVEVQDAAAKNVASGQLAQVTPSDNYIQQMSTLQQGDQLTSQPVGLGEPFLYTASTVFQTSARFPNLSDLPFHAVFNESTLAAGQRVSVGSLSISYYFPTPGYSQASSLTLIPQVVDGAVTAVSNSGSYTVYTVQLASYDPIVQLNSPAGATVDTLLPNANVVHVYVDSSTSLLNTTTLGVGATFRFEGLLFNDNGVLRMACNQVNNGVPQ
jgi:hypothetical protein